MKYQLLFTLLVPLLWAPVATPAIDAMELAMVNSIEDTPLLYWQSVLGQPFDLDRSQLHEWDVAEIFQPQVQTLRLQKKESRRFFLPPYQSLRLYRPDKPIAIQDITVYQSSGSGLLTESSVTATKDGHSLIIDPNSPNPLLIDVRLSEYGSQHKDELVLQVLMSKRESLKLAEYPELIWLVGQRVWLHNAPWKFPQPFWTMQPFQPVLIEVTGPVRLKLRHRLQYEPLAEQLIQDYRIGYRIDRASEHWLDVRTSVDRNQQIAVNHQSRVLGLEQQTYLEIPSGQHRLELFADRNVYFQLLEKSEGDYLFPTLNQPFQSFHVSENRQLDHHPLLETNIYAQQLARDNRYRDSALTAQYLSRKAAQNHADYPKALAEADQLRRQFTFYRDLLPSIKQSANDQYIAYFQNKRIELSENQTDDAILSEQHHVAALNRLGSAHFTPLPHYPEKNHYFLPKRSVPTWVKMIVDKRGCTDRIFYLQMDQLPVRSLVLRCEEQLGKDIDFVNSLSEEALLDLQQQLGQEKNPTLSHLFAAYRKPAPIIPVAFNEIVVPPQVSEITIWSDEQSSQMPNVALQIRAGKTYRFSEQSYLARMHELTRENIFRLLIDDLTNMRHQASRVEQQLLNQWIPLKRFLLKHYRDYNNTVADKLSGGSKIDETELERLQKQAQLAEQHQQWIQALNSWNRIVEKSDAETRDRAQLAQATILQRLSENYLAESLYKYLTLHAETTIAAKARQRLFDLYNSQHNDYAIQRMAAALFVHRPTRQALDLLTDSLARSGQDRFILLLGLASGRPRYQVMLKAAYRLKWWQTFHDFLKQLPESQQLFWHGLRAQQDNDYKTAIQHWSKLDNGSWLKQLQQGMAIAKRLCDINSLMNSDHPKIKNINRQILEIYQDWSDWQQLSPGARVQEKANHLITDSAGSDLYYSIERDKYSTSHRGTQQRPVKMKLLGPVKLDFQLRILYQHPDSRLDSWIQITDNNQLYRYPFTHNQPVKGFELTGAGDYFPGNLITVEYQVGQGWHEIELSSPDAPVSVSVQQESPELWLTPLALLQADTFTHALNVSESTSSQILAMIPVEPSTSLAVNTNNLTLPTIRNLPQVKDSNQASKRMVQYLALFEKEPETRPTLLFLADQLQQRFPDNRMIQSLWNRMSRFSQWQTTHSIISNAGERFVDSKSWLTADPKSKIRQALLTESGSNQHVITGKERLLIMMTNFRSRLVRVAALLDEPAFLTDRSGILQYRIDEQLPQQLEISRAEGWKQFKIQVPEGQHQVRFSLLNPVANQFLKLRFQSRDTDMQVARERRFFVSTHDNPLRTYIHGPAILRIDEWLGNKITSRFQSVESPGWQVVTIGPDKHRHELLLQIRQKTIVSSPAKPLAVRARQRSLEPVLFAPVKLGQAHLPVQTTFSQSLEASLDKISSRFGTWSFGTDSVRRNNVQEDRSLSGPVHFQQFRMDHHILDEFNNTYWNTRGFVRLREHGGPSFGFNESIRIHPSHWPLRLTLDAKLVTQQVDNEQEWMGQLRLALSRTFTFTPKTSLIPRLSWFGRYLSLRNSDKLFPDDNSFKNRSLIRRVDQDLYTIYKAQHTRGLVASLLLIYKPWLDTRWTARVSSVSNEDMNLFLPDHVSTEVHWKQLLGDVDLDASARVNFYQQDNNRVKSTRRHFTRLRLNWQGWVSRNSRLELSGRYNYDIDRDEHLGMVSFTYHYGEGRGYRDFKPSAINFSKIRKWQRLDGSH